MAFAIRNLSVLAYANGFTLWHYKAGRDRLDLVEKLDFFSDAADMLAEGDMMMVTAQRRWPDHLHCLRHRRRGGHNPARIGSDHRAGDGRRSTSRACRTEPADVIS